MGTTLTGTTPQDTYDSLIKVTDNGPLSGTLKALSDGLGNDSTLSLSTTAASIAGTLAVTGNATFDTSTLFVDATNNRVGVGTVSPTAQLTINLGVNSATLPSTPSNHSISLQPPTTADYFGGGISWSEGTNTAASICAVDNGAGGAVGLVFSTGNNTTISECMRITSAGNVGIGTSAPNRLLEVLSGGDNGYVRVTGNRGNANDVHVGNIEFFNSFSTRLVGEVRGITGTGGTQSNSGQLAFYTNNDGTYAERLRILSSGGITFNGDTAAANALDDYEEGTWTMGVSFGGGDTGITYTSRTGNYTKIGRQVNVTGWVRLSSKGSSTGIARITGLPFTNGAASQFYTAVTLGYIDNISFADVPNAYVETSATTIYLGQTTNAGVLSDLTDANFANNSTLMINATYFV